MHAAEEFIVRFELTPSKFIAGITADLSLRNSALREVLRVVSGIVKEVRAVKSDFDSGSYAVKQVRR